MHKRLLVVGARPDSLGAHVIAAGVEFDWEVVIAGISGEELHLDVTQPEAVHRFLLLNDFHSVVCTVGVNWPSLPGSGSTFTRSMREHLEINATGPLTMASYWYDTWCQKLEEDPDLMADDPFPLNFVAVSSNSAHIARSTSAAYCASKAALSMGIRCMGRYVANASSFDFNIYGYEPGWIVGTPMSKQIKESRSGSLHRIPGGRTVHPEDLAMMIVMNLSTGPSPLNGCMIRIDGGEQ